MPPRKKLKRRNHTVNRSYLKRFSNAGGYLTRVELPGEQRIFISIDDATVFTNFYIATLPNGSKTDAAENAFAVVEDAATRAIRSLVDDMRWPMPTQVKADIAAWIALQHLRGPSVRQLGREIAKGLSTVGISVEDGTGHHVTLKMPTESIDSLSGPSLQLGLIRRQLPVVARMLYQRDWVVTDYRRKTLTTSDTPVVLFPTPDDPRSRDVGVANASAIYVPLDRRTGLLVINTNKGDRRVGGTARSAMIANEAMTNNTRKYLFHHPDDDPLADIRLPQPRVWELPSPADAARLAEEFFR